MSRVRLAVVDYETCKPRKCNYECITVCPVNKSGRAVAIEADMEARGKPVVYEDACIGCGLCVKACPFDAIFIINMPSELEEEAVHRYGINAFKLYRLPVPREGQVVGVIGRNAMGKTTAIKILLGELKPNLGVLEREVSWDDVVKRFRGSELQLYFEKLSQGKVRGAHKIQYVELVPRRIKGSVGSLLLKADERGVARDLASELGLDKLWDRDVRHLSGGELQKLLIAAVLSKDADIYVFDEPSSYLDVRERIRIARLIRREVRPGRYYVVVEHDLAMLDYLSDTVHVLYGEPGVYGIVSKPYGVRSGINNLLDGYLPAENVRLRKEPLRFKKLGEALAEKPKSPRLLLSWTGLRVRLGAFTLEASGGELWSGEVVGIVGPNGIGKTTFIKALAGKIKPEGGGIGVAEGISVSYKPQYVSPEMFPDIMVGDILGQVNPEMTAPGSWLYVELVKKLKLDRVMDRSARSLSGGELQKLALCIALGREADVYLLDEPSAYLDVEERLTVARIVRRLTETRESAALVIEHDVMIVDFVSDRLMVFLGEPGVRGEARPPTNLRDGMNTLLKYLGVTFRRDPQTGRPRVNKEGSYLDRMQKAKGEYYYT